MMVKLFLELLLPSLIACNAYKVRRQVAQFSLAFGLINAPSVRCYSSNLPEYNGASLKNSGTILAIAPIIKMRNNVYQALEIAPVSLEDCGVFLKLLPNSESGFKKVFDEYSEGISYKQRFLDQNAFLVYYTKGFDGVGRPSIEAEDPVAVKGTKQYGARNDAWVAINDARSELSYLLPLDPSNQERVEKYDLKSFLRSALVAFDYYISLAPAADIAEAKALYYYRPYIL